MQHRLGLTGGIGSGKSTVASMLHALGANLIDADALSRQVTAPGGSAISAIVQAFGSRAVGVDGALDRTYMRSHVFSNSGAKSQLEQIIHPLVGAQIHLLANMAESPLIVFDIPLLVESGKWRQMLDTVMVIDCEAPTQVRRVIARNSHTAAEVDRIIASQAPRVLRLKAADHVIYNDTIAIDSLKHLVLKLAKGWL